MKEPHFWSADLDPYTREAAPLMRFLLTPFSWIYAWATARRIRNARPTKLDAKVICIGNITVGGVGKSPIVMMLRDHINNQYNLKTASLSRGYGGRLKGPLRVDHNTHSAQDVGDEPLMLAHKGEAWIGADRSAAGTAMSSAGVEVILMDDGHQNPSLHKDFSFVVVDTQSKFGNGYVIPKGPLREPILKGMARADAFIIMGDGEMPAQIAESDKPVLRAKITPTDQISKGPYVAFAGIGRPQKVFDTLTNLDADLADAVPFPDHHVYSDKDLKYLRTLATDNEAMLITTLKDYTRLAPEQREGIATLDVTVQFDDLALLDKLLQSVLKGQHGKDR